MTKHLADAPLLSDAFLMHYSHATGSTTSFRSSTRGRDRRVPSATATADTRFLQQSEFAG